MLELPQSWAVSKTAVEPLTKPAVARPQLIAKAILTLVLCAQSPSRMPVVAPLLLLLTDTAWGLDAAARPVDRVSTVSKLIAALVTAQLFSVIPGP